MSAQGLNNLIVEVMRSDEALTQYREAPGPLAARFGLDDEERKRLESKDMGWLYAHGVHPYILVQFGLSIGYDMASLGKQVREAAGRHASAAGVATGRDASAAGVATARVPAAQRKS
jgi:hypothetical protein